jgi:two-component system response regulator AtoC
LLVLSDAVELCAADVQRELGRYPALSDAMPSASRSSPEPPAASSPPTLDAQRQETEREALILALSRSANNRTTAARILGVSRRTLYNKLERHGLL